ncbi:MAG: GDP-mannose 4,6-dehydratase [Gammaproteobacteria bacterium]|nr:GDP-mannose 4,6-dehydratase [Gammaproteobacteria bacterium]
MQAEVVGFSNRRPDPAVAVRAGEPWMASSTRSVGDVRDLDALARTVDDVAPSVVFHLAAQPLVLSSYEDPIGTFQTNVLGTANVLEAVRRSSTPVDAVVVVTTDKCYENRGWDHGYRETDRLGGRDPYSASKAAAEHVANAYRSSTAR